MDQDSRPNLNDPGAFQDYLEAFYKRHPTWRFTGAVPLKESKADFKQKQAGDIDNGLDSIEPNEEG